MREDFAAFILTHGRPDRVYTYETLAKSGYTGKIYIVIDDEDETGDEYRKRYGDKVLTFSKSNIAKTFDEGDNFNDRRAIIYARNACFDLARFVGIRYFIQLDDDYTQFRYRFDKKRKWRVEWIRSIDAVFESMIRFLSESPFASVAMSQGGDHLGGQSGGYARSIKTVRKAMNTFVCDTHRQFSFFGRINEDVNTYTCAQRAGLSFLTFLGFGVEQKTTQSNAGGMTELYQDSGTYVKSFYSVMYCPSGVTIRAMRSENPRLHHAINWKAVAPKIIREAHRKPRCS